MHIVVVSEVQEFEEFKAAIPDTIKLSRITADEFNSTIIADACFILTESADFSAIEANPSMQVFFNSVIKTNCEQNLPPNVNRFSAWPGFLSGNSWEIVSEEQDAAAAIIEALGKKAHFVNDVNGLVKARIIAMIINEAYFALGEEVSSKEEIDIAMKLGTNYPFGPFEWCNKIGIQKIADLLTHLSSTDNRYTPAPALLNEADRSATTDTELITKNEEK